MVCGVYHGSARAVLLAVAVALVVGVGGGAAQQQQLSEKFYEGSCPSVHRVVRRVLKAAHRADARIYASLTRLHFHDCFVQGCDGSILLDNSSSVVSEKYARPNNNSARGFEVVDDVKAALEKACPSVVSCADILAIAAKVSVELSGGPRWRVPLGRRDGTTANITGANSLLPSPRNNLTILQRKFAAVGLDDTDLVALSGAHTFGRAQCQFVTDRLYNFSKTGKPDPTLDGGYRALLAASCPRRGGNKTALNDLDPATPDAFDKSYFANLEANRGFLRSDQELFSAPGAPTAAIVDRFASSEKAFFRSFAASMIKMGNVKVLTGGQGEVRKNCRMVNNGS
ncbi:peroxidase A2-like [Lolium rigidum]|uniref:peroxidase A2-like n=1 Tax=Lolium rigidum TaxID=89674 RepID=UPI001F5C34FA|nr:peroxidase A2-like [Lolium rigidum]